jgi:hypothetical protein
MRWGDFIQKENAVVRIPANPHFTLRGPAL